MACEGSNTPELKKQEKELKVPNPSRLLFTPELSGVLSRSNNKTAFDHSVATALSLLALSTDPRKSVLTIAKVLDGVNFNDKSVFSDQGHSVHERLYLDLRTMLGIKLKEQEMGIFFGNSLENAISIACELIDKTEKTFYHGSNSAALESIREAGLIRGKKGHESDVDSVLNIARTIGESEQIFGWYKLNSLNKIFLTRDTYGALKYAEGSPEWFDQFTSKWNPKQPFRHRDFNEAQRYLEERIIKWSNRTAEETAYGKRSLSYEDAEKMRVFFKKYWNIYGSAEPVVFQVTHSAGSGVSPISNLALGIQIERDLPSSTFRVDDGDEAAMNFLMKYGSIQNVKKAVNIIYGSHASQSDERIEDKDLEPDMLSYQFVPKFLG